MVLLAHSREGEVLVVVLVGYMEIQDRLLVAIQLLLLDTRLLMNLLSLLLILIVMYRPCQL